MAGATAAATAAAAAAAVATGAAQPWPRRSAPRTLFTMGAAWSPPVENKVFFFAFWRVSKFQDFRNYFGRFRVFDVEKSDFKIGFENPVFSTFFDEILER